MKIRGRMNNIWLALPLAATVAITACAPQATQQANRAAEIPAVVEQVQQAKMLPVGTFAGMVATYEDGDFKPVVGAIVKVEGGEGQAVTDADGRYVFNGLKPGDYKVAVTKDGFQQGEAQVNLSPVTGTPRVNVAMNKSSYGLKQIAGFSATITGVVTDPRGAALPSATVRIATTAGATGTNQTVPANVNGFYTVTIPNMAVSPISPGYVQVTAFGVSPGGVKVEVDEVWAKPITSASLVVNARCDAFTRPQNMTYPSGTFTPMGSTTAAVDVDWMSTRADEFYLLLTTGTGQKFAVLPESIANTPAAGAVPQKCNIKFRVPFAFPPNDYTYTVQVVPFGVTAAAYGDGTSLVTDYTAANLGADLAYTAHTIADASEAVGDGGTLPNNVNRTRFVAGEDVAYALNITNSNEAISQDLKVKGKAPVGSTITSATVTTTYHNGAPVVTNIAAGNIVQPNGTGDWSVTGFSIPRAFDNTIPAELGKANVVINFASSTAAAPGTTFAMSAVAVDMPSANLTDPAPPGATVPASLTVTGIDRNAAKIVSKVIDDGGTASDGFARVTLVIDPTATTTALGAMRFTDQTASNQLTPASKAVLLGTVVQPAAPTAMGLNGPGVSQDKIGLIVDGGAEVVVSVASAGWDLETLCAFINGFVPGVTASRDAGTNKMKLERNVAGDSPIEVKIGPSTTGNMLTKLGFTAAQQDFGTNGIAARFTNDGNGAHPQPTVTQAVGGTTWQFATSSTSTHNADGSVTGTFSIEPTGTVAPASYTPLITIVYPIDKMGGGAGFSLGGGGAAMGPKFLAVNQVAPFATVGKDIGLAVTANTDLDDPAVVNNL